MAKKGAKRVRRNERDSEAFHNVKDQLAYCGLWCGSCLVGNGTVKDRALCCRKAMTDYGVHEWGPREVNYEELLKGLAKIGEMQPCVGCLKGGGRTDCEIRACATRKGVVECIECSEKEGCNNIKLIDHMRTGARAVGMKVKDEHGSISKQLETWMAER